MQALTLKWRCQLEDGKMWSRTTSWSAKDGSHPSLLRLQIRGRDAAQRPSWAMTLYAETAPGSRKKGIFTEQRRRKMKGEGIFSIYEVPFFSFLFLLLIFTMTQRESGSYVRYVVGRGKGSE